MTGQKVSGPVRPKGSVPARTHGYPPLKLIASASQFRVHAATIELSRKNDACFLRFLGERRVEGGGMTR